MDLGNLASIDKFVESLKSSSESDKNGFEGNKVDVYILNAAVAGFFPNDLRTGLNPMLAVNFLGNVYLFKRLVEGGLAGSSTKVIVVSSGAHYNGRPFDFPVKANVTAGNALYLYAQSKLLLQTWFEGYLNSIDDESKRPYVAFWNPGPVYTSLGASSVPSVLYPTYWLMKQLFFVDPYEVAKSILYLMSTPTPLKSRDYLEMRVVQNPHPWTREKKAYEWLEPLTQSLIQEVLQLEQQQSESMSVYFA
uniref:Protochlorophyllide reductase n=1 Tax=Norrisiella sphaerica TaxID=552664 RepID=A0A7S2QSJ9_9EUKA